MRLIDADSACHELVRKRNNGELDFSPEIELMLIDIIQKQPTAYDVDKVEEQITDLTAETFRIVNGSTYIPAKKTLDIVKGGSINEKD